MLKLSKLIHRPSTPPLINTMLLPMQWHPVALLLHGTMLLNMHFWLTSTSCRIRNKTFESALGQSLLAELPWTNTSSSCMHRRRYTVHRQGQGQARFFMAWPSLHRVKGQVRWVGPTWPNPGSTRPDPVWEYDEGVKQFLSSIVENEWK